MFVTPFYVPTTTTFTKIASYTNTAVATSLTRLGIYGNATNDIPGSLILDAGTVSASTATTLNSITINQSLSAELYWLACASQTAAPNLKIYTGALAPVSQYAISGASTSAWSSAANSYFVTGVSGSLPASFSGNSIAPNSPIVWLGV